MTNSPREFWLMLHGFSDHSEECLAYYQAPCEPMLSLSKHVIEYSAFEKLQAQLNEAAKALQEIELRGENVCDDERLGCECPNYHTARTTLASLRKEK